MILVAPGYLPDIISFSLLDVSFTQGKFPFHCKLLVSHGKLPDAHDKLPAAHDKLLVAHDKLPEEKSQISLRFC